MKTSKPIKLKKDGCQVMVAKLSHMEPKLWAMLKELGERTGNTRSTQGRLIIKAWFMANYKNITINKEIDWSEV